jgi:hypothetical protein
MKRKNLMLTAAISLSLASVMSSCSKKEGCTDITAVNYSSDAEKDDGSCTPAIVVINPEVVFPSITVSGNITTNTTWTKANIVNLNGRVIVIAPAELTIEAGTVIKGAAGTGASASVLVVGVGAKIHATGTVTEPIIFTSSDDQIVPGNIVSPNLTIANKGLWGGVIILGDAPISPATGTTAEIEGFVAGTDGTTYGGADVVDNSGEFQYCSIRHGGSIIGGGNEINGLTLGGVGNLTTIDHVEVFGNLDDGIECFGGSVNLSSMVVVKIDDDSYDVDQAYSGTISNFMAIISPTVDGDAFEIDGPEGSSNDAGLFTFDKGLVIGSATATSSDFGVFKSRAQGTLKNIHFTGFNAAAKIKVDGAAAYGNYSSTGTLIISNNTFNVASLTGVFSSDQAGFNAGIFDAANTTATGITNGFDITQFSGWSLASQTGQYKN